MQIAALLEQKQIVCDLMCDDVFEDIRLLGIRDFEGGDIEGAKVCQVVRQMRPII